MYPRYVDRLTHFFPFVPAGAVVSRLVDDQEPELIDIQATRVVTHETGHVAWNSGAAPSSKVKSGELSSSTKEYRRGRWHGHRTGQHGKILSVVFWEYHEPLRFGLRSRCSDDGLALRSSLLIS